MRVVIYVVFLLHFFTLEAQIRYNKVYDKQNGIGIGSIGILKNDSLFILGSERINTFRSMSAILIDTNGDSLNYKIFDIDSVTSYLNNAASYANINSKYYTIGVGYRVGVDDGDAQLFVYDKSLNLTNTYYFGQDSVFDTGVSIATKDSLLYLFTAFINPATSRYAYKIYQTDTLGNLLWDTIYGMPNKGLEMRHATIDSQGNCWIGGTIDITNQTSNNHIVKFNPQWQKVGEWTYGEPTFGGSARFQELPNGEMLVYGSIATIFDTLKAYTAIIDGTNQLTDLHYYPDTSSFSSSYYKAILSNEQNIAYFLGATNNIYYKKVALLRKINYLTGEVIWEHRYAYNEQEHHQVYDLTQAPDGGFYIVGSAINFAGNQDVWVVKTDADGCLVENCLVGQEEVEALPSLEIFPNPTTSHFTIQSSSTIKSLTVYNLQGQQVLQKSNINAKSCTVEEQLPSGVYVVKVETDESVEMRKVLVGSVNGR